MVSSPLSVTMDADESTSDDSVPPELSDVSQEPDVAETAVVSAASLTKVYGATTALAGASVRFNGASIVAIVGPNGAGKTTLIECLIGKRQPDGGSVEFLGQPVADYRHEELRDQIGFQPQSNLLPPRLTPLELVTAKAALHTASADPATVLARFGLEEKANDPCRALSGGQQKRVALALAFVGEPKILVLDEPTSDLDPLSRETIWQEIRAARSEGVLVLMTTHSMEEAEHLADRVVLIKQGVVTGTGSPRDFVGGYGVQVSFIASAQIDIKPLRIPHTAWSKELRGDAVFYAIRTVEVTATLRSLFAREDVFGSISDLVVDVHSMHEVYIEEMSK